MNNIRKSTIKCISTAIYADMLDRKMVNDEEQVFDNVRLYVPDDVIIEFWFKNRSYHVRARDKKGELVYADVPMCVYRNDPFSIYKMLRIMNWYSVYDEPDA